MSMKAALKLGPANHGRPMTDEEFLAGDYVEGYEYELINGKLYVAARPGPPHEGVERWLHGHLFLYARAHPEVINVVSLGARVFVPDSEDVTAPEPDLVAYHAYPTDVDPRTIRWEEQSPILVVEIVSPDDPDKDLERNRDLYLRVQGIQEYWVLDPRGTDWLPSLRVHRRVGRRWRIRNLNGGTLYTTSLLPGLELRLDTRT
jgi:Uma2 family endonuclease